MLAHDAKFPCQLKQTVPFRIFMDDRELLEKMARTIKKVINAADAFPSESEPVVVLPKDYRWELGECLDDLRELEAENKP